MSQAEKDAPLSDEQLEGVSGGLSEQFEKERESILNKTSEGSSDELSDDQLKDVSGGLSEQFKEERESVLNKTLSPEFESERKETLNK